MHGLEFGLNLSGGHSPVARIPEQMQARLQVPSLGGQRIIFWAGRFDTIDGLCEKVANKWPGPPQIQPQASDLRLFCSGKELGRNATAEDVGLFFIHLEVEVVVALEAVAGGARPLSACVGAAFAAGGGPRAEEVAAGGSRGPRGSVARATFPRAAAATHAATARRATAAKRGGNPRALRSGVPGDRKRRWLRRQPQA